MRSNLFMSQWVSLYGTLHMTKYIHIIGLSHLTYFAKKYGNLYCYSQQGWEALNQLLKHYYFNNINHGGSYGNGGKSADGSYSLATSCGDHCRPLMRLCQQSLMWKLGIGDTFFLSREHSRQVTTSQTVDNNKEQCGEICMFGVI
jgi:hypothetical protein